MADTASEPASTDLPSGCPEASSKTGTPADCVTKPAASPEVVDASKGPTISFKVQYGKNSADLKRPAESTVGELKADVEKTLGISPAMQKLMFKGKNVQDDAVTLQQVRNA
jgi:hypothetical protein